MREERRPRPAHRHQSTASTGRAEGGWPSSSPVGRRPASGPKVSPAPGPGRPGVATNPLSQEAYAMMRKLTFLAGFAVGYVAGAQAGRERYEQIMGLARKTMNDPRVKDTADKVQHQAADLAGAAKEKVQHQAADLAGTAKEKVTSKIDEHRSSDDATMSDSYGTTADDSVYVVDINDRAGIATGTGPTGNNDRMGL